LLRGYARTRQTLVKARKALLGSDAPA